MSSILLRDTPTEEDNINYIRTQIERDLCLPFSDRIHANLKFWADKLPNHLKSYYFGRIKEWFDGASN